MSNEIAGLKDDLRAADKEFKKAAESHNEEKERLVIEKRVANANIYLLRNEQGTETEDFTQRMSFDELEHTYIAFKKFYKEQWKKTKKSIRASVIKEKLDSVKTNKDKNKLVEAEKEDINENIIFPTADYITDSQRNAISQETEQTDIIETEGKDE
jgi:hypothetical protein